VLDHYHPGDSFGEAPLLLGSTIVADLRAITDARVARLDATAFHHLLSRSERLAATIMRTMARRVGNLQRLSVETVVLDGGEAVAARAIILATGVSWRSLAVPGAATLVGRGIYYGAARTEVPGVRGKDVYLVGGGNSAGQAALFFVGYAR